MASLGPDVYCGQLTIQNNLKVGGAVTSSHKVFGNALNEGQLHHNGSVFYIKWSAVHQCSHLTTANGAATATWTTTAAHNLVLGDTVHMGKPVGSVVSVNDIPKFHILHSYVSVSRSMNTTDKVVVSRNVWHGRASTSSHLRTIQKDTNCCLSC